MKRLVVLGGGTAGTMAANKLRRRLDPELWQIAVVDRDDRHLYQPGFLFIPFGTYRPSEVTRSRHRFIPDGVEFVLGEISVVDADAGEIHLADGPPSKRGNRRLRPRSAEMQVGRRHAVAYPRHGTHLGE
jgi:sulfide:quinone oxidoreductase